MEKEGFQKYYEKEGKNKAKILDKKTNKYFYFLKNFWKDIILK